MPALVDLTGRRFERLVVRHRAPDAACRRTMWLCDCSCGATTVVFGRNLVGGRTKSCGCLNTAARPARTKHGGGRVGQRHPLYSAWLAMKQRCSNPNVPGWHNYGGRGITVCERWSSSFADFLADVGERPPGRSIDRVDNDGPYAPDNFRWATPSEQRRNQRPACR